MRKSELQEGPLNSNFQVEIKNAHEIYLERQRMLGENQGVPEISLSQTDLDGKIFRREYTDLGIVMPNKSRKNSR